VERFFHFLPQRPQRVRFTSRPQRRTGDDGSRCALFHARCVDGNSGPIRGSGGGGSGGLGGVGIGGEGTEGSEGSGFSGGDAAGGSGGLGGVDGGVGGGVGVGAGDGGGVAAAVLSCVARAGYLAAAQATPVARKTGSTMPVKKSPWLCAFRMSRDSHTIGRTRKAAHAAKATETSRGCFRSHASNSSRLVISASVPSRHQRPFDTFSMAAPPRFGKSRRAERTSCPHVGERG
jgi:hypothetical protein